jgi:hypothetical protein
MWRIAKGPGNIAVYPNPKHLQLLSLLCILHSVLFLCRLNRFEWTLFHTHQTSAAKRLVDIRQFVRLELDERLYAASLAR